jgi:hypothetical protein
MSYPDNYDSVADAVHAAPPRKNRAWLYLQRALGRGSKQSIASDIDRALTMLYSSYDALGYLAVHKLPPTKKGLRKAARQLLNYLAKEVPK